MSGDTPPNLLVIQVPKAGADYSDRDSGGPPWRMTFRTMSEPASPATSTSRAPVGLLQPLPVPCRPWSHVSVDVVTGLPCSSGNTVILNIVDRFSKMAHFIPVPKLPSTKKETAQLPVQYVFHLHGLLLDAVSDKGPQFSSIFCLEFCKLLGAIPSLSSGFHPQSNGQTERKNQDLEAALNCMTPLHGPPSCCG